VAAWSHASPVQNRIKALLGLQRVIDHLTLDTGIERRRRRCWLCRSYRFHCLRRLQAWLDRSHRSVGPCLLTRGTQSEHTSPAGSSPAWQTFFGSREKLPTHTILAWLSSFSSCCVFLKLAAARSVLETLASMMKTGEHGTKVRGGATKEAARHLHAREPPEAGSEGGVARRRVRLGRRRPF
jgi:hypothetical protein